MAIVFYDCLTLLASHHSACLQHDSAQVIKDSLGMKP